MINESGVVNRFRHVLDYQFGSDTEAFDKEAIRLAEEIQEVERKEGIKLDSISKEIILRRLYETYFGIYNHYDPNRKPLDLVAARQKEEVYLYSKKVHDISKFIELGVHTATGLSLDEFFELPYADAELIFELVAKRNKSDGRQASDLEEKFKQTLNELEQKRKS